MSIADKTFTRGQSRTSSGTTASFDSCLKIEDEVEARDDQQKFVVFISQVHQLFKCCQVKGCWKLVESNFSHSGGVLHVHWCCKFGHKGHWTAPLLDCKVGQGSV